MYQPADDQLKELGTVILDKAQEIFELCQAPDDFCIQHIHGEGAIFGGWNRIIWRPEKGFYPDPSYCSQRFLNKYQANCLHFGTP